MRQIYSSQRLENVDKVEALMQEADIETYVSGRDKLRRDRRRRFSYTERGQQGEWPAVWVVNADDLPKARDIMRDAGLMGSTRPEYAAATTLPTRVQTPESLASKVRRGLLILVVVTAVMMGMWWAITTPERNRPAPAPKPLMPAAATAVAPEVPQPAAPEPASSDNPNVIVIEDLGDGS
ncbi:hypothetical protein C7S18_18260 [Ahniella affigens]|uniref:Pathogenicity-like protein n=1 Tax=Ahniella affigens TaxID=2021234 RepID=A0A2P1PVY2_9GAMM|nr:hypothetical protein [Ahniella affigens]AVP98999.1 hypothetical protein C7S18_18260 [Ahniella affigens]